MKDTKRQKGITLIALVVTIIVLLLLAGVSIMTLTGQNGILKKAKEAKEKTEREEIIENIQEEILERMTEKGEGNISKEELREILVEYFDEENIPPVYNEDGTENEAWKDFPKNFPPLVKDGKETDITIGDIYSKNELNENQNEKEEEEDNTAPTAPRIEVKEGAVEGNENWYRSEVTLKIIEGTDKESGVEKTTYIIEGAQETEETTGKEVTITEEGKSYITAYTYDKAGNKTASDQIEIKKDTVGPEILGIEKYKTEPYITTSPQTEITAYIADATSGVRSESDYTVEPKVMVSGNNDVTYTASDIAGNVTIETIIITLADVPSVCFIEGTKVSTPKGLINIEELKVGDKVYTYNEKTKKVEEKKIQNTITKETELIAKLIFDNGEKIENTVMHPYYVIGKGWRETKDLEKGDKILTQYGREAELKEIKIQKTKTTKVYNMTIEDNHDYFVGRNKLLVHNAASPYKGIVNCGLEDYPVD